jgi:hypothetical protein
MATTSVGVACRDISEPSEASRLHQLPTPQAGVTIGKTVLPEKDTYIRSDAAHKNYGTNDSLRIQKVGTNGANRVLIAFNQVAIADSLAGDSLISATLELTIKRNGNNWGASGRNLATHKMLRQWTEGGATWACAHDTNVGNNLANCPGDTWSMSSGTLPYATSPVAQALVQNNQSGVVSFNVTADVRAFLLGQATNLGWLIKLAAESQTGTVVFHSRQATLKPRLVLSIHQGAVPPQAPRPGSTATRMSQPTARLHSQDSSPSALSS